MPRKRNPVGIAVGKVILAVQNELGEGRGEPDAAVARKVMNRARTLLQASQSSSVPSLLNGKSVVEYLDADWVEMHPAVKPSIEALMAELGSKAGV
jgi:hypothetical protein